MTKKAGALPPNRVNVVAENTVLEGTLQVQGDVQISGHVIGVVEAAARVVVTSAGVMDGDITADAADVAGTVEGDLGIAGRLVLRDGAHVEGTVEAGTLVVEDGAVFNGSCRISRGKAHPPASDRSHRPVALAVPKASSFDRVTRSTRKEAGAPLRARSTVPSARKGDRRWSVPVVLGGLVVMVLATGAYYSLSGISAEGGSRVGRQAEETDEPMPETASLDDLDDAPWLTPAPLDEALPDASPLDDPARQTAGLNRIAMEEARRRILPQSTAPAVASFYQEGEAARQAGSRRNDAGDFEEAARAFRAAQALYVRMQQVLDEAGSAQQDVVADTTTDAAAAPEEDVADMPEETPADTATVTPADTATVTLADSTSESVADSVAAAPAEMLPEAVLDEVRTVVRRLARQLERTIEQEDVDGMRALYYRGWESFFEEAEGISAVVRPENVRLTGAEAQADVYLDLAYQGAENQSQQGARAHVWTLIRQGDEWVLRRVSSL